MGTLANKTLQGIKWSTTATIINLVLQTGYTAIMARLLDPVSFGLVAMANVVLRFGGYFANMGMSQAIIQKQNLDDKDIRAAFTTSVVLGFTFFGLFYFLAPLSEYLFNDKDVIPIVKVLSASFVLSSLATTSFSLIRRRLQFKEASIIQIVSFAAMVAAAIFMAWRGLGVWSLVYASLIQGVLNVTISYLYAQHSLRLFYDWKVYKPLFAFGGKITFISFIEFLSTSADTMMIGRYLGAVLLGIYNRAFMIVQLPLYQLNISISRVLFPVFSSIQKETAKLRKIYLSSISVIAFLFLSICAGVAVSAENIVFVVLGEDWAAAVPILQILAILVPFKLLAHYGGIICDATASLNIKIILEVSYIIVLFSLLFLIRNSTLLNYSYVLLGMEGLRLIAYTLVMKHILEFNFVDIRKAYLSPLVTSVLVGGGLFLTNIALDNITDSHLIKLIADMMVGGVLLLLSLFLKVNRPIWDELNQRLFSQNKFLNKFLTTVSLKLNK